MVLGADEAGFPEGLTIDEALFTHYYGLLHEEVPRGPGGMAPAGFRVAAGRAGPTYHDYDRAGTTAAQEIGHNLFRAHAPCGDPDFPEDPFWPHGSHPRGSLGQTGFDVVRGLPRRGTVQPGQSYDDLEADRSIYKDFMSYCRPLWVSTYVYEKLYLNYREFPLPLQRGEGGGGGLPVDHILVGGVIDEGGAVILHPIYHWDFPAGTHDDPGTGGHSVVLLDSSGANLRVRQFELPATHGSELGSYFFEILPYHPDTARIEVRRSGVLQPEVLVATDVTSNSPVIQLLYPNGGEVIGAVGVFNIEWTASDPDDDDLSYGVLFSKDAGATWEALDVGLVEASYEVEAADLPGTPEGLIRVVASDGVNTSSDDSDGVFAVEPKGPDVLIFSPPSGTSVDLGTALLLHGAATDAEDGPIPDESLEWISSLDGFLGSGTNLLRTLSGGRHAVTLTGRDADGNLATATVMVTVLTGNPVTFLRGNCNSEGEVDIADGIAALSYLFSDGAALCREACNANGDGLLDIGDPVYLFFHLFEGGPPPLLPYPECDVANTEDCEVDTCSP